RSPTRRRSGAPTSTTCCAGWSRRARSWRRRSVPGERSPFQYAILRVVPRVERGERVNAGVVLFCRPRRFLAARVGLDPARLAALAPDLAVEDVQAHLDAAVRIAAGDPAA